jgi:hypothetical protein
VDPVSWRGIVKAMPPRTVLMFGDAIKAPTAMDVLEYNEHSMTEKWQIKHTGKRFREKLKEMSDEAVDDLFKGK